MTKSAKAADAEVPAKRGRGAPSDYTAELATTICQRIADGESLRSICADDDMPARSAVFDWLGKHPDFADQYARAREMSAEADADDVAHYARKAADGDIEPAAARAAIDGLKWSAGKRQPKKYGDAMQMKVSGAVGTFDPSKMSDKELERFIDFIGPIALRDGDAGGSEGGEGEAAG